MDETGHAGAREWPPAQPPASLVCVCVSACVTLFIDAQAGNPSRCHTRLPTAMVFFCRLFHVPYLSLFCLHCFSHLSSVSWYCHLFRISIVSAFSVATHVCQLLWFWLLFLYFLLIYHCYFALLVIYLPLWLFTLLFPCYQPSRSHTHLAAAVI